MPWIGVTLTEPPADADALASSLAGRADWAAGPDVRSDVDSESVHRG